MSERYITLADGTTYDGGECGRSDDVLVCWLPSGTDMIAAFGVFANADRTNRIVFYYGGMQTEYDGYTDLRGVHKDFDERLVIQLRKGGEPRV